MYKKPPLLTLGFSWYSFATPTIRNCCGLLANLTKDKLKQKFIYCLYMLFIITIFPLIQRESGSHVVLLLGTVHSLNDFSEQQMQTEDGI